MPFLMVRGDIAKMRTDAVVIPAAGAGQPHKIRLALCRAIMRKSFGSSAPSIIYVIVPAWTDDRNKREQLLEKAYRSALRLAVKNDLRSIAFPLLSSGNTRFAQEEAFRIARSVITAVVRREELSVYLVLQDHDPFIISHELSTALTSYIAVHEPKQRQMSSAVSRLSEFVLEADEASLDESLEDLLSCRQETFSQKLLSLIDQKDYRDAEVYHRANLDRRHFAKIRSNPAYAPKKNTVLALCIALRLDLQESEDLLRRAGYAFSPCSHADLIVRYFIEHGRYDIFDINEALFYHDLPLLGQ
ncbi:MAG TPA: macro domain-containing protein [Candidatus Merdibacter merdavium]|uniref:Macro domain-containing protein n=1 Tax=Candidatus Merdibacter merdavium TaxID=2838692 RepID=A0A9D2NSW3_9FIRM|nr:macro domain-containing protein [Candidatus Merdibacter merdavium]